MQVLLRSTTRARPRVAFPGAPVSEAGMVSPTTTTLCRDSARAAKGSAIIEAATHRLAGKHTDLTKGIHRDCLEPGLRVLRFALTDLGWRIERARDIAVDLGVLAILRLIKPGKEKGITRRDRGVASASEPRRFRGFSRHQANDRRSTGFGFSIRGRCGFGDTAGNAGIADDVELRHELRSECKRSDRAPAGMIGDTGDLGDAAGLLRRGRGWRL